jgi:hypothetical protein
VDNREDAVAHKPHSADPTAEALRADGQRAGGRGRGRAEAEAQA